jgi:hypothetical protein
LVTAGEPATLEKAVSGRSATANAPAAYGRMSFFKGRMKSILTLIDAVK